MMRRDQRLVGVAGLPRPWRSGDRLGERVGVLDTMTTWQPQVVNTGDDENTHSCSMAGAGCAAFAEPSHVGLARRQIARV